MSDQANYVAATSKNHSAARRIGFVGNPATSISKRMFDKVAAAALLVVSAQLLVLIAIAIRIESRGPVLFRQERFGLDGATIKLTKFRTMYHHMADANGRQQATHCDSRVTRVGRFLRRTTLDELPQFWDVLVGRMSLVGPRPHPMGMTINDELASDVILRYKDRLRTRPGITGLAQIRGNRGPVPDVQTGQRRINLDNEYIETWTFMTDIKILLKTVVVPFQKGCY